MKVPPINHSASRCLLTWPLGLSACLGLLCAATLISSSLAADTHLPDVTADYRVQIIDIPLPPNVALSGIYGVFMNDNGMVAIQYNTPTGISGTSEGLSIVREKGVWTVMNIPGAVWIGCGNPTASGRVPLCYGTADGNEHNAIYHKGAYTHLPDKPLPWQCSVQMMNDYLIMTGLLFNPEGPMDSAGYPRTHGVLMNSSFSLFKVFDVPGAEDTGPMGINNALQIVGNYWNPNGHAFLSPDGGKTFVSIEPPGSGDGTDLLPGSVGYMINNEGEICGAYFEKASQKNKTDIRKGFLLRKGKFSAFYIPKSSSTQVMCITDRGLLSGYYTVDNPDGTTTPYAFSATPKHEHGDKDDHNGNNNDNIGNE